MAELPVLEARGVVKSFGANLVLKGLDLTLFPGEVVVVIGPSGCGKSTLLRCLNFLEPPDRGQVLYQGEVVSATAKELVKLRSHIGMVFQGFHLFPHLSVLENLTLAPTIVKGEGRAEAVQRAHTLLIKVGLEDKAGARPDDLSGGQAQRVAIARCLMMEPEVLLFDEPTSSLDPELVGEVLGVISGLASEGRTMCVVTHEMAFARRVGSRIVMLDEGEIIEEGSPTQLLDAPDNPRTQRFLRRVLSPLGVDVG